MALFTVMDFETPGDNLFSRNFCRAGYYTDETLRMGWFKKKSEVKTSGIAYFLKNIVIK